MLVQSANYPKGEMYANARGMRDQINNEKYRFLSPID